MSFSTAPWIVIVGLLILCGIQQYRIHGYQTDMLEAELRAEKLSNELVIEQAKALSKLNETAVRYVERIRHIPATPDDEACRRSERMRAGSRGVRDIIQGPPGGGPDDAMRSSRSGH